MLRTNDSKENISSDIFSEISSVNIEHKVINGIQSSSLHMIALEEQNSQLQKDILKQELEFNKKVEMYESKLVKFKELNSINQKYQQEIFDLKKRLDISTQQNAEQKSMYMNEIMKLRNELELQIFEIQEKNENLQKKLEKSQQLLRSKDSEKSNLDQQLQIQSNKITTLLKSASDYFNFMFLSIDSFISFFSNNKNTFNESEDALKKEKKKRKSLEKKCLLLNKEKSKNFNQIEFLTNQNKSLKEEIDSLKTKQEIDQRKIKINQLITNFDEDFSQKNFQQHQNQIEKVTQKIDLVENNDEKDEEIHNLHKIIIKLKKSLCQLQKKNQFLKQNLKLKESEVHSLKILNSNFEDKFNQYESNLQEKPNSKIEIMKLKRKNLDLSTTIENLHSEIIKLNCEHKEEMLQNEIKIKKLQEALQSNSKPYSNSYSILSTYSNSFNDENQSKNQSILDSSYCIDDSVPTEITENLKEIIENKGLKINLKIRLITKSLSAYFSNLLKNKNNSQSDENKIVRKALLERAKELASIAESQSAMNKEKSENRNSSFKKSADSKLNESLKVTKNTSSSIKKSKHISIQNNSDLNSSIKNNSNSNSSIKDGSSSNSIKNNSNSNSSIKDGSNSNSIKNNSNSNSSIKDGSSSISIKNNSNSNSIKNNSNSNSIKNNSDSNSIKNNSNPNSCIKNNSNANIKNNSNSNTIINNLNSNSIKNNSNLNSNIKKSDGSNSDIKIDSNSDSNNKKDSKQKLASNSSKTSKSDINNQNVSDLFTSNLNGDKNDIIITNTVEQNKEIENKSEISDQNTITQIESISHLESKSQQNSSIESNNEEETIENFNEKKSSIDKLISDVSLFEEEEEEYLKEIDSDKVSQNSDEEDIISGIESLVDDLKLKID